MSRIACRLIEPLGDGTYRDEDTGRHVPLLNAPAGSMWFVDWLGRTGPDGRFLVIRTHEGTWCPDLEAPRRYVRRGLAPMVTVSPDFEAKREGEEPYRCSVKDGVFEVLT